jgi:dephospho-CoA kinase
MSRVIGIVGRNGSGKDMLADYLSKKYGIPSLSIGDLARDLADKEGIAPDRHNLHDISHRYRALCGKDYFINRIIRKMDNLSLDYVAVTGVRTAGDIDALRSHFGRAALIVSVEVGDPRLRFERTRARGALHDPKSYDEFLRQDREEEEMFKIEETMERSDITIENLGEPGRLFTETDRKLVPRIFEGEPPDGTGRGH